MKQHGTDDALGFGECPVAVLGNGGNSRTEADLLFGLVQPPDALPDVDR